MGSSRRPGNMRGAVCPGDACLTARLVRAAKGHATMIRALELCAYATVPVALMCIAAPVSAQIKTATYSGVITSGNDNSGLFGAAGSDLSGLAFSVAYTYDLSQGYRETSLPGYDALYGGGSYGFPVTKVIITINGVGRDNDNGYAQELRYFPTNDQALALVSSYNGLNDTYNLLNAPGLTSLGENLSVSGSGSGYFYIGHYQPGLPFYPTDAFGNFDTQALVVTGVPEPESWALMLAGFGTLGTVLRRRGLAAWAGGGVGHRRGKRYNPTTPRSTALTRVCHPGPDARSRSTTSGSSRSDTNRFGASDFGRPRRTSRSPS